MYMFTYTCVCIYMFIYIIHNSLLLRGSGNIKNQKAGWFVNVAGTLRRQYRNMLHITFWGWLKTVTVLFG